MNPTIEDFAMLLDRREYTQEITKKEEEIANANNFVVCFGASDDLLEFRGAIHDEFGAYGSVLVYVINGKPITKDDLQEYFHVSKKCGDVPVKPSVTVEAIWCYSPKFPKDLDASWLIKVEGLRSASFDIMEDNQLYCRGVVFALPQKNEQA